jgi:hypothetical protein
VALLAAVLVPARVRRVTGAVVCAVGYAGAIVAGVFLWVHSEQAELVTGGGLFRDRMVAAAAVLIGGIGVATVLVAAFDRMRDDHVAEYYALLATAGAGMIFFVGAGNLMTLFLALEWFSICLYVLCAIDADRREGLEAGLKYLVTGGFGSAILLFGCALVYGASGELGFAEIAAASAADDPLLIVGLAMIITGLGFKASVAPFHMWTPDVYQGAPTSVTGFMSSATKVAALLLTLRLLITAFPAEQRLWTAAATSPRSRSAISSGCSRTRPSRMPASCSSASSRSASKALRRSSSTSCRTAPCRSARSPSSLRASGSSGCRSRWTTWRGSGGSGRSSACPCGSSSSGSPASRSRAGSGGRSTSSPQRSTRAGPGSSSWA